MTVRLLTNIGRLWTGTDVCSNAAVLVRDDRIVWAGPASDLPQSVPGVIDDIVDVDHVENLGGGLVTPGTDPWPLCNAVRERLRQWVRGGTTTVEAKTGYHLTRDGELADVRMLR